MAMNRREARIATALLEPHCDMIQECGWDYGGVVITAHWVDGCQTLFHSLTEVANSVGSDVEQHRAERAEYREACGDTVARDQILSQWIEML